LLDFSLRIERNRVSCAVYPTWHPQNNRTIVYE